jgi:uncharacterized protein YabN with tetrapyrrole methylase and pyrophosphatase domain
MESWIFANNKNSLSLDSLVSACRLRKDLYNRIADAIVANVKNTNHVCVVFYGHPTIFAKSALDAAHRTKADGYATKILPGISAEDCLFADLCIDPGSHGCQSYETTDFLIRNRYPDPTSHLVLWQAGIIGALGDTANYNNQQGASILRDVLLEFYSPTHPMIAYEAALYPHTEPKIQQVTLQNLTQVSFSTLTTLYIAPTKHREINMKMLQALNINPEELK